MSMTNGNNAIRNFLTGKFPKMFGRAAGVEMALKALEVRRIHVERLDLGVEQHAEVLAQAIHDAKAAKSSRVNAAITQLFTRLNPVVDVLTEPGGQDND